MTKTELNRIIRCVDTNTRKALIKQHKNSYPQRKINIKLHTPSPQIIESKKIIHQFNNILINEKITNIIISI